MRVLLLISLIHIIFFSSLCYGMQLRKHDQRITEPSEEETVLAAADLNTNSTTEHHTNTTRGCGVGTMICLTFASDSTDLPVKCGTLTNVPLCQTNDPQKKEECKVFCDSDGGARLCRLAFDTCCTHSTNGCISSRPINIRLYQDPSSH